MVHKIQIYGSPTLRVKSLKINEGDRVQDEIETLFKTLQKSEGIGLSGVQIGILKRVFVIDTSPLTKENPEIPNIKKAYINPKILRKSETTSIYTEGCLSIPGIFEEVERPGSIKVKYQDVSFQTIEKEIDGLEARIFQHEFDHLEGILFIDKLVPIKRKLLSGKLNSIKKLHNK